MTQLMPRSEPELHGGVTNPGHADIKTCAAKPLDQRKEELRNYAGPCYTRPREPNTPQLRNIAYE